MKKKLLSVVLSIAVAVTMMPGMVFATDENMEADSNEVQSLAQEEAPAVNDEAKDLEKDVKSMLTEKASDLQRQRNTAGAEKTEVKITGVNIAGMEEYEYEEGSGDEADWYWSYKTYDGKAVSYEGTPVARTQSGEKVNIKSFTYEWEELVPTAEKGHYNNVSIGSAPKNVGEYVLVVSVPENNKNYIGEVRIYFDIMKKEIEASGVKIKDKVYDGTTKAEIIKAPATLNLEGVIKSDKVSAVKGNNITAEFQNKDAEEEKNVDIKGYELTGDNANNYSLRINATANINRKPVTVTDGVTIQDREYSSNGSSRVEGTVDISKINGIIKGDQFKLFVDGYMDDPDIGKNKPVEITGHWTEGCDMVDNNGDEYYVNDGPNYDIDFEVKNVTVNIAPIDFDKQIKAKTFVSTKNSPHKETVYFNEYIYYIDDANITKAEITEGIDVIENVSAEVDPYEETSNKIVVSFNVTDSAKAGDKATVELTINSRNYNEFKAELEIAITDKDIVSVDIDNVEDVTYGGQRTVKASAIGYNDEGDDIKLSGGKWTWESSDPEVLSVTADKNDSSKAVIEGKKADQTGITINATYTSDAYIGSTSVSNIWVNKKQLIIKPKDIEITVGGEIPELNDYDEETGESVAKYGTYTVKGLINGDSLTGKPELYYCKRIYEDGYYSTYGVDPDNTKAATYTIAVWYDDSAEDNYYIDDRESTGKLTIVKYDADGTKTSIAEEEEINSAGNHVIIKTVTKEKANGKKTVERTATIKLRSNAKATVKVKTDNGKTVSTATVTQRGTKLKSGEMKSVISGSTVKQIKEAAGKAAGNIKLKTVITDTKGKQAFSVTANTSDLKAGNKRYILKNGKTGKKILVNANKYTVAKNGNVTLLLKDKGDFVLVTKAAKDKAVAAVKKTIAPTAKTKTLNVGKTTMTLKKTLDKANVKSITYKTMDKKVATVNKAGKVTAKKKGTATIKATVTLKDGSKKTVSMQIKVR